MMPRAGIDLDLASFRLPSPLKSAAGTWTSLASGAALVFSLAAILAYLLHGHQAVLTGDEGILLEPAQRVIAGARPYTDFFAVLSPGSYWIQALAFRVLGVSIIAARLPVILDFAAQCALIFWLVQRYASTRAAWFAAVLFFCFQTADPEMLTAQHRWDSATLALLSVALCLPGRQNDAAQAVGWRRFAAAGAAAAYAALCTPSVGLAALVSLVWLASTRERRRRLLPYGVGMAAIAGAAAAYLLGRGMFGPFLAQLAWLQRHYVSVNIMPYGSINGGYAALFAGVSAGQMAIEAVLVICLVLPALLPVASALAWGWALAWRKTGNPEIVCLLFAMAALVASAFPRADVMHLAFVAAPAYVLTAVWISQRLSVRAAMGVGFLPLVCALLFLAQSVTSWAQGRDVVSPVGALRTSQAGALELANLLAKVRPGDSLYVHPYLPVLYFWTQARNPTRYAYLNPGMMTGEDEARVLEDLTRRPPEWVLYLPLAREEFLRVFSSGRDADHTFPRVESWIRDRYRPEEPPVSLGGYQLLRRKVDR
jgi:Dolichyl-phosphate-mannose-protein mannosyltransferase